MSTPSSLLSFSTSPARRMTTPSPVHDEKHNLDTEIGKLKKKAEHKEEVILELNKTILLEDFQNQPYYFVQKLIKQSLSSSMDRIGQDVRRFFAKNEFFDEEKKLIEGSIEAAIRIRIEKMENLCQTILKLTKIRCDPNFQKDPKGYLTSYPEEDQLHERLQEILVVED